MPDINAKMERILFDYVTTNKTSYRGGDLKAYPPTLYHAKPKNQRPRVANVKDVHTLTEFKTSIPFNLLHQLRPIVNTNPKIVQQKYEKTVDTEKEEIQKTRPRLVMTPAVSMDDIPDRRARNILVGDMYTSETARALREAVSGYSSVQAPYPGLPAPSNPIVLPKLQPPMVPPEWRMETVSWDNKQLRGFCDPTRDFWLSRDVPECRACKESAIVTSHRKMLRQIKGGKR